MQAQLCALALENLSDVQTHPYKHLRFKSITLNTKEKKLTGQLHSLCLFQASHTALVVHLLEAYLNCKDPCDGNGI